MNRQRQQTLVRFENKTHVIEVAPCSDVLWLPHTNSDDSHYFDKIIKSNILSEIANRTGWKIDQLALTQFEGVPRTNGLFSVPLFCNVRVRSGIIGGKGGFGTLLKGQSRQAGAKATTNFDACRDLQGRRLKHVNDLIKYSTWKEWSDKVASGAATQDEMVKALLLDQTNNSGISGWHLQLPSWADVSMKREVQKNKRIYYLWRNQMKQKEEQREQQRRLQQKVIDSYIEVADNLTDQASKSVTDSFKKGYEKQMAQKRKRVSNNREKATVRQSSQEAVEFNGSKEKQNKGGLENLEEIEKTDSLSAFVTLSGDIVIGSQQKHSSIPLSNSEKHPERLLLQSKSNFASVGILLDQTKLAANSKQCPKKDLCYYYEVGLVTKGIVQVGWALINEGNFCPNSDAGDGVGDDSFSWAIDIRRNLKLHNAINEPYGPSDFDAKQYINEGSLGSTCRANPLRNGNISEQSVNEIQTPEGTTIIGCMWNCDNGELSYTVDGVDYGRAFCLQNPTAAANKNEFESSLKANKEQEFASTDHTTDSVDKKHVSLHTQIHNFEGCQEDTIDTSGDIYVFPALSFNENEIVELILNKNQFQFMPSSTDTSEVIPISDVLLNADDDTNNATDETARHRFDTNLQSNMHSKNDNKDVSERFDKHPVADTTHVQIEKLDLNQYETSEQLQELGLHRLKGALMAVGLKCGGTLQERASRLFSVKGLEPKDFPSKLKAKGSKMQELA